MPSNYNRISTCFWWRLTAARWVHTSAAEERALANRKFSPGPQVKANRDTHARVCTRSIALAQGHPLDAAAWRNRAIRRESVKGTLKMAPKTCLLGDRRTGRVRGVGTEKHRLAIYWRGAHDGGHMSFRLRASTVLVASLWVAPLALAQTEHVLKEGDRAADFPSPQITARA